MNTRINKQLTAIRQQLENSWGPDSDYEAGDHAEGGEPGELGATNVSDAQDNLDKFLDDLMVSLLSEYDMSEDDALDFIFSAADQLATEGALPPFPEEGDDKALALWLGQAQTVAFGATIDAMINGGIEDGEEVGEE